MCRPPNLRVHNQRSGLIEVEMNIIVSIIFGAIAGWIASIIMRRKTSVLGNILVGIVGSMMGGFAMNAFGVQGVTGINLVSLIVSVIGASVLLFIVGLFRPKSTERPQTPTQQTESSNSETVRPQKETRIPSVSDVGKLISPWIERQKEAASIPKSSAGKAGSGIIFISYRRSDSAHVAGRVYDRLVGGGFGKASIFKDVDSIPLGLDFKEYLDAKVGECSVLLAIIGDRWLDASDSTGKRRLDDPTDFVRIELESALIRNIPVIPLLVSGAPLPSEAELPLSLRTLVYRNGIAIRPDPDFHRDMDRLIAALKTYV